MNNLSYRHLQAFLEVAQQSSFTKAALHLHVTQSTLTATIKQLETQVDTQLFDRTTRQVNLTQAGERFYPVAERLISDFDAALSDLRASALQEQGEAIIAAAPSVIEGILPHIIEPYHQQHPNISLRLLDAGASHIETLVLNNQADFGIGSDHSHHPDLSYRPLLADQYGIVFHHSHHLSMSTTPLNWSELANEHWVLLSKDNGIRIQLEAMIAANELALPLAKVRLEVSTTAALAAVMRKGLGISCLPALAARTGSFHDFTFQPFDTAITTRQLCVITRKGRSLNPVAQELLQRTEQGIMQIPLPSFVNSLVSG